MLTRDKAFYRSFATLMLALMLQQAVVLSVNLADNIMLGGYSETALSGVAAVNQIQFILQQLVFGVSNGMIVLGSQYWGQKRIEPIRKLISIAFWCAAVIILVLFGYVSLFPRIAVGMFTKDEAIIEQGMAYLSIVRFTYPFFAVTTVLLGGLRCVEKVKIALYVAVMALVVNCTINFLLITGQLGFPELGVRGAAIGTLTARILECVVVCWYVFRKKSAAVQEKESGRMQTALDLQWSDLLCFDRNLLRSYLRTSIPVIFSGFLWGCNTALQTVILGHMSSNAIAAHSISSTIFLFLKVTSVGAASAAAVLVGKTVGTGNLEKVKEYTRTLQVIFISIGLCLGAILFFLRIPLLGLYALSPETRQLADTFMIIEATVLVVTSYQMCVNTGIICGGGDTRFIMYLDLIAIWGIVVPLSCVAAFVWKASPVIVLLCLNLDQYLKCIPAFLYGNSYRWVKTLT